MRIKKHIIVSTAMGVGLELFDFVIYLFLSPIIATIFFPHQKNGVALLATLGGFAAGYLARPLGGIIYGHFGDRIGRIRPLTLSLFSMAIPTFLISCLPTYSTVGVIAPILLVIFRFAQGFAMGGDIPGAICFISEHFQSQQRGFMTCCLLFGMNMGAVIAGILIAALISLLTSSAMLTWGWRIPFIIGALLAMIGVYIRRRISETPEFQKYLSMRRPERWPLNTLIRTHFHSISLGFCIAGLAAGITTITSLFMSTYMTHYLGIKSDIALWLNSISICAYCLSCLVVGLIIDRFNALRVLEIGSIVIFLLAYPIFMLISSHHFLLILLGLLMFSPLIGAIMGSLPSLLIELFPTPIRYSGIGITYNFGFSLFAGTTPLLSAFLISITGTKLTPAFMIMVFVVLAFPAIIVLHKRLLPSKEDDLASMDVLGYFQSGYE